MLFQITSSIKKLVQLAVKKISSYSWSEESLIYAQTKHMSQDGVNLKLCSQYVELVWCDTVLYTLLCFFVSLRTDS